ncbi:hypothetical protein LCGC14_0498430 [marine sediment metagenome]|uniref:Radical SAM core domain-containing protein n=1 Tax=marine sediment metagenome TaxID=412755 RepID=A0A0F9S9N7_9ZZZZ
MTTDLVLVNPNGRLQVPFAAVEPPLWLGLIAGNYVGRGDPDLRILDAEAENLTIEQTVKRVEEYNTKDILLVVMGNNPSVSSTPKWPVAGRLLKRLPTAMVAGLHPMAMKHPRDWGELKGTPSVPWEMFDLSKYRAHNWHCLDDLDRRSPYAVLYTSLNCPFSCHYCNIHALYGGHTVRYRPMEKVKQELDYFAAKGIRNIKIWDECFTLNTQRVREICDYIISQGYDFNMWAYGRLDSVDPVMLSRMWRAGIRWIAYGFESTGDKKFKQSDWAVQVTQESGLSIIANFMFGLPGEKLGDMQASLDYAMKRNFEWLNLSIALPYPGSPWWYSLKRKPTKWERFGQFNPNMYGSRKAIDFRREAFKQYFSRPEYLKKIGRKFGDGAVEHIKGMLKWQTIERFYALAGTSSGGNTLTVEQIRAALKILKT